MKDKSKIQRFLILLFLGLLTAISPFSIDMYLPAFGDMAGDLNTSVEKIQLSLTSYFIGVAIGQMIYGPLLDKFGRKKPLIAGLVIYIAASLFCAVTNSADYLILFRLIQALGGCCGMVASRAMVRDYYDAKESAKIFSLLMLVVGISPILAPSVGAFVLNHFEWHIIFIILTLIGVIILLGTLFILPESYQGNASLSLKPADVSKNFWSVLKNPDFLKYCLIGSFASSGLYAYLAGSSFVMQEYFGLSASQYGTAFAFISSALIIATQINRFLLNRWSSAQISLVANYVQVAVSLGMLIATLSGYITLPLIIGCIFFYLCCQGFIFPNTSALALAPFRELAGSASALLGCIQMALGAFTSALVSYFHNNTAIPMVGVMFFATCSGLIVYISLGKNRKQA